MLRGDSFITGTAHALSIGRMNCYECSLQGEQRVTVGLGDNCIAALCKEHIYKIDMPVTAECINRM